MILRLSLIIIHKSLASIRIFSPVISLRGTEVRVTERKQLDDSPLGQM